MEKELKKVKIFLIFSCIFPLFVLISGIYCIVDYFKINPNEYITTSATIIDVKSTYKGRNRITDSREYDIYITYKFNDEKGIEHIVKEHKIRSYSANDKKNEKIKLSYKKNNPNEYFYGTIIGKLNGGILFIIISIIFFTIFWIAWKKSKRKIEDSNVIEEE